MFDKVDGFVRDYDKTKTLVLLKKQNAKYPEKYDAILD